MNLPASIEQRLKETARLKNFSTEELKLYREGLIKLAGIALDEKKLQKKERRKVA